MPTTGRYQTYLPNTYKLSSSVQISVIASNVHVQFVEVQFNCPFSLSLMTKLFTFKRIKHINLFIIARLKRKLHFQGPGSRVQHILWISSLVSHLVSSLVSLGSWVPPMRWVPGLVCRVPPKVPGLWFHF